MKQQQTPQFKSGRGYENYTQPSHRILDAISLEGPWQHGAVHFQTDEFTSMCPITSQPDWATEIHIEFNPLRHTLETKSLKLYLHAFRNYSGFAESINLKILNDIFYVIEPTWISVSMKWKARGGISIHTYFTQEAPDEEE